MSYSTKFRRQSRWLRDNIPFCVLCGKASDHIHHIDGDKTNDSWINEIPLCTICHAKHPERDPVLTQKLKKLRAELWLLSKNDAPESAEDSDRLVSYASQAYKNPNEILGEEQNDRS